MVEHDDVDVDGDDGRSHEEKASLRLCSRRH